jgi:hypothetical protein
MNFIITKRSKRKVGKTFIYSEQVMNPKGEFNNYSQDAAVFNTMNEAQFVANGLDLQPNVEYMVSPFVPPEAVE